MAQIAGFTKGSGPPAELGQYVLSSSAVGFIYTHSGVTYYAVIRSGPLGWDLVGDPSIVPETTINQAFAALGAGARITLLDGTWPLGAASIAFTANQQVIEGQGRGTFIDATAVAAGRHGIVLSGFTDCVIRNLSIDTKGATGAAHCIFIEDGADRFVVEHVVIVDSDEDGIHVEGTTIDTGRILNYVLLAADRYGIFVDMDGGNFMLRLHIESCDIGNCGGNGIFLSASAGNNYCEIVNNVVYSCTIGIYVINFDNSIIRGNICILGGGDGIQVEITTYAQVLGNICFQNGNHGIFLVDADYCTVENNTCVENDSGDTATYDGINVDADSTGNNLLGNVCVGNHNHGIRVLGAGNSMNSNVSAENDRIGIYILGSDSKVNDNLCYHNGADINNTFDGIVLGSAANRSTVNGNTCYGDSTRQRHGISLSEGATDCIINGNICYLNATDGIQLVANNNDCGITGNHCLSNGAYGISIAAATCLRNRVKDNILRLNGTAPFQDLGTDTQLETIPIPLIQGTTFISAAGEAWGWEIDEADEFALGIGWLPYEVQQVVRIRITGVALADPGAGNEIRAQFTGEAATFHEPFATHPIDVVDKDCEETDPDIGDVIHWVLTSTDAAEIANILGGDRLQLKVLYEDAGDGSIATDAIVDTIQVEIV